MSKARNTFFLVILVAGLLPLSGCQYSIQWFIRNLSSKEVVLSIHYETREIKYRDNYIPLRTKYAACAKKIVEINYNTADLLTDSLEVKQIDRSTYCLIIPPGTTVEATYIIPTQPSDGYYDHRNVVAIFEQEGTLTSFNSLDVFKKKGPFKREGSLTLKNLVYYDYIRDPKD